MGLSLAHLVRCIARGARLDRELEREVRFHLDMEMEKNVRQGAFLDTFGARPVIGRFFRPDGEVAPATRIDPVRTLGSG